MLYSNKVLFFISLGMKDSWGPLKALVTASAVNGIGHVVLCSFLRYGLVGAAWATLVSQVCQINFFFLEKHHFRFITFFVCQFCPTSFQISLYFVPKSTKKMTNGCHFKCIFG